MHDVPKNFMIRCLKCRWAETSTGISDDLKHLTEIPRTCMNCGTPRQFKCPKCGRAAKMLRIKKSAP
jgi:predicted RNA-binding Zn-ribbon protein involved in translation (DUF1610 family)